MAVLNNAKSLRLTTEQTQRGLLAQDILFCIMLCCTFVPHRHTNISVEVRAEKDYPDMALFECDS